MYNALCFFSLFLALVYIYVGPFTRHFCLIRNRYEYVSSIAIKLHLKACYLVEIHSLFPHKKITTTLLHQTTRHLRHLTKEIVAHGYCFLTMCSVPSVRLLSRFLSQSHKYRYVLLSFFIVPCVSQRTLGKL